MDTGRSRWLRWGCLGGMTLAWAVLFYRNYWQAAVPAYGGIDQHLAALRLLCWRYVGVGALLTVGWLAGTRRSKGEMKEQDRQHVSERGA